jgi:hypothetical protein
LPVASGKIEHKKIHKNLHKKLDNYTINCVVLNPNEVAKPFRASLPHLDVAGSNPVAPTKKIKALHL